MAVRKEKVILDLETNFPQKAAESAAGIALLNSAVKSLSRDAVSSRASTSGLSNDIDKTGTSARRAGVDIDKLSGRLKLFAQLGATLGPGLIPIGAVAIPAIAGLAAQAGFAAVAGGTMIAAFQGVGDALKAVNKAALEPTEANLAAAKLAMDQISPAARELVGELREMGPALKAIRDEAATQMFPGLIDGLDELQRLLPQVQRIVGAMAGELGDIFADGGASLAGERWADFFEFLETDAPSAVRDLSKVIGNLTHAAAEMWMAFDPLNDDFSSWLVDMTGKLDDWASGLDQTEGLQDFVAYIRKNGPQVADTVGAIAEAFVDIVVAAAPLGGPALKAIEGIAKAISAVADSDMGTPIFTAIAGVSALNLLLKTTARLAALAMVPMGAGGAGAAGGAAAAGAAGAAGGAAARGGGRAAAAGAAAGAARRVIPTVAVTLGAAKGVDWLSQKMGFGRGNNLQADLDRALGALKFNGKPAGAEEWLGKSLGGTTFTKSLDNVRQLDTHLSALNRKSPSRGLTEYQDVLRKSGMSAEDLNKVLPKTAAAMRGQGKAAGDVGSLLRQTIPSLARYDRVLKGFPKSAITKIAAEGVPKTRAGIVELTRRYNLTPKMVRTLIREQGGAPTKAKVDSVIAAARTLGRQAPNPRLSAKDNASSIIAMVGGRLRGLDGDYATTYVYTRHVSVGAKAGTSANPTHNADGGTVPTTGRGYADRHHYLLADGEEVISNRHGQADRNRDLLKAINAGMLADGGTTRGGAGWGSGGGGGTFQVAAPSMTGLTIRGVLDTPFGPAEIEGLVVDILDGEAQMAGIVERAGG